MTVRPCHRALPDAQATAEVLLGLIGLAQERGAETVEDVIALALAAPRRRAPAALSRDRPADGAGRLRHARPRGQALYVGKAGDLRTRVRSYFGLAAPAAALEGALARSRAFDAAPLGSELEAALAELD